MARTICALILIIAVFGGTALHAQVEPAALATAVEAGTGSTADSTDRKSTRLNSSHIQKSRMPSSA